MVNPIDISATLNVVHSAERVQSDNIRLQPEALHQMQKTDTDKADETRASTTNPVAEEEFVTIQEEGQGAGGGQGKSQKRSKKDKEEKHKKDTLKFGGNGLPGHIDVTG
jgi:hypothetical protein